MAATLEINIFITLLRVDLKWPVEVDENMGYTTGPVCALSGTNSLLYMQIPAVN